MDKTYLNLTGETGKEEQLITPDMEQYLAQQSFDASIEFAGGIYEKKNYDNITVIRCCEWGNYCATDKNGTPLIPLGKYNYIDGFDHGYARVNRSTGPNEKKWGIINTCGKEIVPVEYDNIWNFLHKDRQDTRMEKDGEIFFFIFDEESIINIGSEYEYEDDPEEDRFFDEEERHYERYSGSYAQDEMGYSDEDIDTIFDGDPDAYWNID